MITQVTLACCLATGAQASGDCPPYLIYIAAKLQTVMEPGGHNSAKAALPELSAIGTNQSPAFADIKKPYKKGDALSIINTAHSCVKSAVERLTAYHFFFPSYFSEVWRSPFLP